VAAPLSAAARLSPAVVLSVPVVHGALGNWDEVAFAIVLSAILLIFSVFFVRSVRKGRQVG
jgi:hypothetical protein